MRKYVKRTMEDVDKELQEENAKRRHLMRWLQDKYPDIWKEYGNALTDKILRDIIWK